MCHKIAKETCTPKTLPSPEKGGCIKTSSSSGKKKDHIYHANSSIEQLRKPAANQLSELATPTI